jgi:virulence-associated protein VapD
MPDAPESDTSNSARLASEEGSPDGKEGEGLSPELKDLAGTLEYHDSALSENTRRAYQRGWEDFAQFCEEHGFEAAPASEQAVALYLSARAEDLAPSTLSQRMAAIQHAHDERGLVEVRPKRDAGDPPRKRSDTGAGPAASHRTH